MTDRARLLRMRIDLLKAELSGVESGVLPYIEEHGPATPAMVAEELGFSLPAANNQLTRLYRACLLARERIPVEGGGRAYRYRLPD